MKKSSTKAENTTLEQHETQAHTHDGIHYHTHESSLDVDPEHSHPHEPEHSDIEGHAHTHEHVHGGGHPHHHENTKAVINRMNRAIGHMESVKKMVEDGRDCSEVLIQIAAVRSAINNIGKVILEDHINHCVVDAIETGDEQVIRDLNEAIKKFVK